MLPFIGTSVGAATVFVVRKISASVQKLLGGFSAGVMVAASVWSLIIPGLEMSEKLGRLAFLPLTAGIVSGFLIMHFCERILTRSGIAEGGRLINPMQFLAVTLHNFPEGMAVGMMFSMYLRSGDGSALAAGLAFSLAIALQNIPEGAIISMPYYGATGRKGKAFLMGVASGAVEPVGAVLTLVLTGMAERILPFLFGFAAGAMLFTVADELLVRDERHPTAVAMCFGAGFCIMMAMDVALG